MSTDVSETKPAGAVLSVIHWLGVAAVAIGGSAVQSVILAANVKDKTRKASGRFYRDAGVAAMKISPVWDFEVYGTLGDYRPTNTVVVSNHQSQADPFLISQLPWEMKWLGKDILFKVPFAGWMMHMAGDIPIDRGNKDSAKIAMAKCSEYLQNGMPIMIFPEGTRSRDGKLLPFKQGAFRLAIENGSDILPLAVAGTMGALPKGSWKAGFSKARVIMGEPISTEGMTMDDVDRLSDMTREAIIALQAKIEL